MGISDGIIEDLKYIGENYAPKIENAEKKTIIRNIPKCECYQKLMKCYFIHTGICNSKSDIKVLKSGILIVDNANDCECKEDDSERVCDECGVTLGSLKKTDYSFDKCKAFCDANTIVATG